MTEALPPVVAILGATGTGKTDLAVALVERLGAGIISVDSAMVYRGLDIGTAKPDAATLARAPHRLIDICDPAERYSAARFRSDALEAIEGVREEGRLPLLVGGTGLYFRALEQGLAELPPAVPELRRRLQEEWRRLGPGAMHRRLAAVDPVAASRIHPNDPQRLLRALEVYEATGEPLSRHLRDSAPAPAPFRLLRIGLRPPSRAWLRGCLERRFRGMLERGLVEEVERFYHRGDLSPELPSMRMVGYRQVWQHLAGELEYGQMVERAVIATCQLAKRQETWFRGVREVHWLDALDPALTDRTRVLVESFLNSSA
ncbi:MAG: tRNA (adenosine(37)-N6)-dimethylallyltransferase MiaA [Gammaproteobacteria bacterium]|nr:MAG: tRNA (adenosine(37)-N6)-dimethylallyltransferase MiaA [Gammaproteobacteria bacterium]